MIIFLFVFTGVINVLLKNKREENNISHLTNKMNEISQQNEEIRTLIKNYNSETNREKLARENLNLMLDGESVVVINDKKKEIPIPVKPKFVYIDNNNSSISKWINFFFEHNSK